MNRFSLGGRLYQRNGVYMSFSMKRQQLDRAAKLVRGENPPPTRRDISRRSASASTPEFAPSAPGERTYSDKEFDFFGHIPRPFMRAGVWLLKTLDYYNLLPASFIENDPLYTSMFCANLGSLHMGAGFHHLYEYGTCSTFTMAGQLEDRPVVENGRVEVRNDASPPLQLRRADRRRPQRALRHPVARVRPRAPLRGVRLPRRRRQRRATSRPTESRTRDRAPLAELLRPQQLEDHRPSEDQRIATLKRRELDLARPCVGRA